MTTQWNYQNAIRIRGNLAISLCSYTLLRRYSTKATLQHVAYDSTKFKQKRRIQFSKYAERYTI